MLKKQTLSILGAFTVAVSLSACQPKPAENLETSPAAVSESVVEVLRLRGENQKLNLGLDACKGNDCSVLIVERLQSNQAFIDERIDQEILKILAEHLSDAPRATVEASIAFAASELPSNQSQLEAQLVPYTQAFQSLDRELKALSAGHPIHLTIRPKILNANAPVATVVLNSSSYLGGAHGASAQQYFNFDLNKQHLLSLKDIVEPKKENALKEKSYQAFKTWLIETELADSVSDYEQVWPFVMTDNFYLGQQGLILQYAEYEIGPYVVGLPRLVIPYAELTDILKHEYLPQEVQEKMQQAASTAVSQK